MMPKLSQAEIQSLIKTVKKMEYWEKILGLKLGEEAMLAEDIDKYIIKTYAKELRTPEVMARILGGKQED